MKHKLYSTSKEKIPSNSPSDNGRARRRTEHQHLQESSRRKYWVGMQGYRIKSKLSSENALSDCLRDPTVKESFLLFAISSPMKFEPEVAQSKQPIAGRQRFLGIVIIGFTNNRLQAT